MSLEEKENLIQVSRYQFGFRGEYALNSSHTSTSVATGLLHFLWGKVTS
jgi:hypothetical protein